MGEVCLGEQERRLTHYYSDAGAEPYFRNWGAYEDVPVIYAIHSGFYPSGMNGQITQRQSIVEMDKQLLAQLALGDSSVQNVVDLGCGSGATVVQVAECYPEIAVWGVTLSPVQARTASEYIKLCGLNNAHVLLQSYAHLGFRGSRFDRAWFVESLSHAADREITIAEAARVLKPGGFLHIQDTFLLENVGSKHPDAGKLETYIRSFLMPAYKETLKIFLTRLELAGFSLITVRDITENVFPSAELIGSHAEMKLVTEPNAPKAVKFRREGCVHLRDLMAGYESGNNIIGYFFIKARRT